MAAVPAFKPTVLNQAGQDALKQNLQGVSFSNVTPAPSAVGYAPSSNGVIGAMAGAYNMTKTPPIGGLAGAMAGTPAIPKPQGTFNPASSAGDGSTGVVPAMYSGSSAPKFDAYGIAASKVAARRAALAGSVAAYDASRKQGFDYTTKNTQDQRVLDAAMFHEQNNPFSGKYQYDKTNILRNNGIQDTQNQMQYNNDIAASDAKLAAFDAGSAGLQQDLQQQLEHQNLTDNISQAGVTGTYNGSPTYAASQDTITNNRNAANDAATYTGNYTSPQNTAIQQQMAKNSAAYASASPEEQQRLHNENLALGKQLGQTYDPNTGTYSGGNGSVRTIAGQTLDMNNAKDMATLTGYMSDGKGGYIPTNAKQQQDLSNAWTATNNLGSVTPELSRLTGIEVGTPTQQAINQSQQIAVSNRNATNSENSTSNSNNNAKINQLMEVWKNTGVAPAGLESVGVKQGDKYTGGAAPKSTPIDSKLSSDNHATISQDLKDAKTADEANALIEANRNNLTDADYKDLKKQVIDKF